MTLNKSRYANIGATTNSRLNYMTTLLRSNWTLLVGIIICAASTLAASANTQITFSVDMATQIGNSTFNPASDVVSVQGTYNGWASFTQLTQVGASTVYSTTYNDTAEANGNITKYQFVMDTGTYETSADFNLRAARLPATSGASLVLPTPFFNDNSGGVNITNSITFEVDVSQQIALGNFNASVNTVEVQGNFNGWTSGAGTLTNVPTILRTNQYGLVTSNVYVGTFPTAAPTNAAIDYKFVLEPGKSYESVSSLNGDNGGNRFYVNNTNQVFPVVDFSDTPYAPLANITFNVDMAAVYISDPTFDPTTVTLDGDFNSWSTPVPVTNSPGGDTNIFSTTIVSGVGAQIHYQYRYNSTANGTIYDNPTGGGNRFYQVPNITSTNLPAVFFDDINVSDLLNEDTTVLFSVNMTNAVDTTPHTFDPNNDLVYINGDFVGWQAWNSHALTVANLGLTNNPVGSEVYSFACCSRKAMPAWSIINTRSTARMTKVGLA